MCVCVFRYILHNIIALLLQVSNMGDCKVPLENVFVKHSREAKQHDKTILIPAAFAAAGSHTAPIAGRPGRLSNHVAAPLSMPP